MLGLLRFRGASGRVLFLLFLAVVLRYTAGYIISWSFEHDAATRTPSGQMSAPPAPDRPGVASDVEDAIAETTIPKIRLDGGVPDSALLTPIAAAVAFGGVVLLVGGVGAVLMWRHAATQEDAG